MITVLIVAVGEAWSIIWRDAYIVTGLKAILFFVPLVVIANYVLLNLVLALLFGTFSESQDLASGGDDDGGGDDDDDDDERLKLGAEPDAWFEAVPHASTREYLRRSYEQDRALGLFEPSHPKRQLATAIINFRLDGAAGDYVSFDSAIIVIIIVSSLSLTLDSCTMQPDTRLAKMLGLIDGISTTIFIGEMLLKMVSLGPRLHTPNLPWIPPAGLTTLVPTSHGTARPPPRHLSPHPGC